MNKEFLREKIFEVDNTNLYESISYMIFTTGTKGVRENIEIMFVTNPNTIYRTSDYKNVLRPPRFITLNFNIEQLLEFTSGLIYSISNIFYSFNEFESFEKSLVVANDLKIVMKLPRNNDKDKIVLDIFDESNMQIISFSLKRTKILFLLMMLKEAFEKLDFKKKQVQVQSGVYLFNITRAEKSIGFNNIWLRNSEIEILRHLVFSLIFDFKLSESFADYKSMHRQVLAYRNTSSNKYVVSLKQYKNNEKGIMFSISSKICAALYFLLPKENSFTEDVINEY